MFAFQTDNNITLSALKTMTGVDKNQKMQLGKLIHDSVCFQLFY